MIEQALSNKSLLEDQKTTTALPLIPRINPEVETFLDEKKLAFDLINAFGSPLNILFPDLVKDNVASFENVFDKFGLSGKTYFAHKANKSDSVLRRLSCENVYVDVASSAELKHALGCGFAANRIEATGPKNLEFLALSLMHNIVINIDNIIELKQLMELKTKSSHPNKTAILLRLSGSKQDQTAYRGKASRFGMCPEEMEIALKILVQHSNDFNLIGFGFHLDTISLLEKTLIVEHCLTAFESASCHGFQPYVLNIGGGFKLSYLANQTDWHDYTSALKEAVLGTRPSITWQGNSFGLKADKQTLRGSFISYNYYDPVTGPKFLEELLVQPLPNHNDMQIANFLRTNGIQIWIEPGRSLLDQVGLTIGRVAFNRKSSHDEQLVCLEMKRQDLCFLDQEFFVDPIILYRNNYSNNVEKRVPVYFAGNLCLESDLIYRHQTFVTQIPQAEDLVVFPNTAGYFMDFSASEAIMQPTAAKVAVYKQNNCWSWSLDSKYQPWCITL